MNIHLESLEESIRLNYFPLVDSLYNILGPTREEGMKVFAYILDQSIRDYGQEVPYIQIKKIPTQTYTFVSNFDFYLLGQIEECDVELVPYSITKVDGAILSNYSTSASYWNYVNGTLYSFSGAVATGKCLYPFVAKIENEVWSETSKIYFIRDDEKNWLVDWVAYDILLRIESMSSIVQIDGIQPIQFQRVLDILQEKRNNILETSPYTYSKWGFA